MAVKLLLGGSPCTHWSIAQKNNRETEAKGEGWELFKNYLIAKEKFRPDYFLYENNKSAAQPIKDQIAKELNVWDGTFCNPDAGVRFTYINSALVSAQNRQRFYVTNFGDIEQPEDRGILLRDILESGVVDKEKAYCLKHQAGNSRDYFKKHHTQIAFEPVCVAQRGIYESTGNRFEKVEGDNIVRVYEAREDGKTNTLTTVQKDNMVAESIRVDDLPNNKGEISDSQATRIYSIGGKSVNLIANGGGQGAKTGLYAVPTDKNGKQQPIYEVRNGLITIKCKQYPIKLPDGFYIIRKLTVKECCRLQTMPDDYCREVSATQGYKGLGNGWTAEVIIHLLRHANIPLDEEITVLSMYDGIGTGRYVLDKMGYKNVKYYAYEIDKYAMQVAMSNYLDIIQCGDAFQVRNDYWKIEQGRR